MSRRTCVQMDTDGSEVGNSAETGRVETNAERLNRECETIARAMVKDIALEQYVLLVPQGKSPLGKFEHMAAVQKRIRNHEPGACVLDESQFLLTEDALAEEVELARRTEGRA